MSSDEHLVSGHFVYDDRPRHDVFWGLLYAGALALTTVGGIYSASHRLVSPRHVCCTTPRFAQRPAARSYAAYGASPATVGATTLQES